jgi:hypothetical protein
MTDVERAEPNPESPGPRRISVPLDGFTVEALLRRARREDRDPRVEAARLLKEALIMNGDLEKRP